MRLFEIYKDLELESRAIKAAEIVRSAGVTINEAAEVLSLLNERNQMNKIRGDIEGMSEFTILFSGK